MRVPSGDHTGVSLEMPAGGGLLCCAGIHVEKIASVRKIAINRWTQIDRVGLRA
jgi:hypothetical protein